MKFFKTFAYYLVGSFILYFLIPENIHYSKDGSNMWPFYIIVIIIPILGAVIFWFLGDKSKVRLFFTALLIGGFLGFIPADSYRLFRIDKEFESGSVIVKGVVTTKWLKSGSLGYEGSMIKSEFVEPVSGKVFETFDSQDKYDVFNEVDTVTISYLKRNPAISRVVELDYD
jgi:hypothetical protein